MVLSIIIVYLSIDVFKKTVDDVTLSCSHFLISQLYIHQGSLKHSVGWCHLRSDVCDLNGNISNSCYLPVGQDECSS